MGKTIKIKGFRFKGLTWEEREKIVSDFVDQGFNLSEIAEILSTSRQNIWNVQQRIKGKNFDETDSNLLSSAN